MDRSEILDLMDSATLQAIKTLTTKRAMMKTKFFVIENVPHVLSIQKIVSYLRSHGNLNFIFFIHKRLVEDVNNCSNWIIGCRNSNEFSQFLWNFKEISIDGNILSINPAKKDLEVRHAVLNDSLIDLPSSLFKMKSSLQYNKFFPSERMMEILIECDTNGLLNLVDGILLNYKHAIKMLDDEIFVSTYNQNGISTLQSMLKSTGNRNINLKDGGFFLMEKSIWCRQTAIARADDNYLFQISPDVIQNNIITNGLDFNSIRNSLL
ncbi:hypothetical protein ACKWTF_011598 [Chironomus riparius]